MPEKTNQDRIKEYLVGYEKNDEHIKGYLEKDISNGKVIMLSGKWGCGKTHFWQNEIATDNLKKELNEKNSAYSYISLYGKSSIEEIENDIFGQIYFSAIGGENVATKTFSTFTKYSKRYGNIFSSFDFSKLAVSLKEEDKENKERVSLERLKNSAIICFDDFERKSKDIDLNDLFGFITQLTINFKCKVVIILNDDVFEGEEKKIFSNVKEKTVSKFLYYKPSIEELFTLIFDNDKYENLEEYKKIILKTIEETEELNARIYIQVLDNLVEWIDKKQETDDDILRCLILVNINFILNHIVFRFNNYPEKLKKEKVLPNYFFYEDEIPISLINSLRSTIEQYSRKINLKLELPLKLRTFIRLNDKSNSSEEINYGYEKINKYNDIIWAFWKLDIIFKYKEQIDIQTFEEINNFIETGILIDE